MPWPTPQGAGCGRPALLGRLSLPHWCSETRREKLEGERPAVATKAERPSRLQGREKGGVHVCSQKMLDHSRGCLPLVTSVLPVCDSSSLIVSPIFFISEGTDRLLVSSSGTPSVFLRPVGGWQTWHLSPWLPPVTLSPVIKLCHRNLFSHRSRLLPRSAEM